MKPLLDAIRRNSLLWLLVFVPALFVGKMLEPETQTMLFVLAVLLIVAYGLGLVFSLKTHREFFGRAEHGEAGEAPWPIGLALTL